MAADAGIVPVAPPVPPVSNNSKGYRHAQKTTFCPISLHFAVNNNDLDALRNTLRKRDINKNFTVDGNTPLILAILKEQLDCAFLLIEGGCSVNQPELSMRARRPMHLAMKISDPDGRISLLEALLEHGAEINAKDGGKMLPIHHACLAGDRDAVAFLLKQGSEIDAKDDVGRTPLFRAIESDFVLEKRGNLRHDIAAYLFSLGAKLDAADVNGWTPLFHAVAMNDVNGVNRLLQLGCESLLTDIAGFSPLLISAARLGKHVLRVVQDSEDDIIHRRRRIFTANTHFSLLNFGHEPEVAHALLVAGCDPDARARDGLRPVRAALDSGKVEFVHMLICADCDVSEEFWLLASPKHVALVSDNAASELVFERVSRRTRDLQALCRAAVRNALRRRLRNFGVFVQNLDDLVDYLPLPSKLRIQLKLGQFKPRPFVTN